MWNLPGLGIEPMYPVLAGGFLSTVPLGKSSDFIIMHPRPRWFLRRKARTLLSQPYFAICYWITCPNSVSKLWNQKEKKIEDFSSLNYTHTFCHSKRPSYWKGENWGLQRWELPPFTCTSNMIPLAAVSSFRGWPVRAIPRRENSPQTKHLWEPSSWACESYMTSQSLTQWGSHPLASWLESQY